MALTNSGGVKYQFSPDELAGVKSFFDTTPDQATIFQKAKEIGLSAPQLSQAWSQATGGDQSQSMTAINDYLRKTGQTLGAGTYKSGATSVAPAPQTQVTQPTGVAVNPITTTTGGVQGTGTVPSNMAGMRGTGQINLKPAYVTGAAQDYGNYLGGVMGNTQDVYKNWYDNPLTTGVSPEMQNYFNQLSAPNPQWTDMAAQAGQMSQQGAQYDPAEMQKHLNPYLDQATDAVYSAANRNLNENLMPGVNTTFAGAGQFGSTRNADFTNRALRDTQEGASKAVGALQLAGWGQAAQDYSNWGQLEQSGSQNMMNAAKTGAGLGQQNLQNLGTAATGKLGLEQNTLTAGYEDWLKRQSFPLTATGQLGQGLVALSNAGGQNQFNIGDTYNNPQADNTTKIIAALQGLGGNQQAIQDILNLFKANP